MTRGMFSTASFLLVYALGMSSVFAATPAGTVIQNTAEAIYYDTVDKVSRRSVSTTSSVIVQAVYAFDLEVDNKREAEAGERLSFPHLLRNMGNTADSYTLSYTPELAGGGSAYKFENVSIHLDVNENGIVDEGEPEVQKTQLLESSQSLHLVVSVDLPRNLPEKLVLKGTITATSVTTPSVSKTREDMVTITLNAPLRIVKTTSPSCLVPIEAQDSISYDLQFFDTLELTKSVREVQIDGVKTRGVVLKDTIPANTRLDRAKAPKAIPYRARPLVLPVGAAQDGWQSFDVWSKAKEEAEAIALFLPEDTLVDRGAARLSFHVLVLDKATQGLQILNRVSVDTDGDGKADAFSNETCNTLRKKNAPAAQIRFLEPAPALWKTGQAPNPAQDSDYADVVSYPLDSFEGYQLVRDGVYLEVTSNTLNQDSSKPDTTYDGAPIRVLVRSVKTNDTLYVELVETGPNTGIFRSLLPIKLSTTESGKGGECRSATSGSCVLKSAGDDRLGVSLLDPGLKTFIRDTALVDPLAIVFDSVSLDPVSGVQLRIMQDNGLPAKDPAGEDYPLQITGDDGAFHIPRLAKGKYYIEVLSSQTYTFPSKLAPNVFQAFFEVSDPSYGRNGFGNVQNTGLFNIEGSNPFLVYDIPLDKIQIQPPGKIFVDKTVDQSTAEKGDFLTYTLTVRNPSQGSFESVTLTDQPPFGFRYVSGSARLADKPLDPVSKQAGALSWSLGPLKGQSELKLTYVMHIGASARAGLNRNIAVAVGKRSGGGDIVSPKSMAEVRISDTGLFSDRAIILGSVWFDENGNDLRDEGETGVPGARIWMDDGSWVETDPLGRYSLYGLRPGLRVAKIDSSTLPKGFIPSGAETRFAGDPKSRFVDLTPGELHRADFPLRCTVTDGCKAGSQTDKTLKARIQHADKGVGLQTALESRAFGQTDQTARVRQREHMTKDGDISSGRLKTKQQDSTEENIQNSMEEKESKLPVFPDVRKIAKLITKEQAKEGTWLWPGEGFGDLTLSRDGRFVAIFPSGVQPRLYVNGEVVEKKKLGERLENREQGAQIAAWYGVSLVPGENELEIRGQDSFGNERILAQGTFWAPGQAVALKLHQDSETVPADGKARAKIHVRLLDDHGLPVSGEHNVTLEALGLVFADKDGRPDDPGHQIRLKNGEGIVLVKAPEISKTISLKAFADTGKKADAELRFSSPMRPLIATGVVELEGRQNFRGLKNSLLPPDAQDKYPEKMEVKGRGAVFLKGRIKGDMLLTLSYDSDKHKSDGLFRDIDPDRYYPIYGDSSERGFEAQSRSKLYVRLENEHFSGMYGDFRSDESLRESLGAYRRSLTGVNVRVEKGPASLQAFGARIDRPTRTELIRGRGVALFYSLPGAPLEPGSETLILQTRSKDTPGLVMTERRLNRFTDYVINYDSGQVDFQEPVGAFDDDGNPIFIKASYETRGEVDAYNVIGVRGDVKSKYGRLWANITEDENPDDGKTMGAAGGELNLPGGRVWLEGGWSRNQQDRDGMAAQLGLEYSHKSFKLRGRAALADKNFKNPDAPITAGRREASLSAELALTEKTKARLAGFSSQSEDQKDERHSVGAMVEHHRGPWTFSSGIRWSKIRGTGEATNFPSVLASVRRAGEFWGRSATVGLEVEQDVQDWNRRRAAVFGDVQLTKDTQGYLRYELTDDLPSVTYVPGLTWSQNGQTQGRSVIGLKSRLLPKTDAYGEWRIANALDSRQGEAAYGIRSEWEIMPKLSISPRLEIVNTLDGVKDQDYWAASFAVADRRFENTRTALRIETRQGRKNKYYGMRGGVARRFNNTFSGAIKTDIGYYDENKNDRLQFAFTIGAARRPVDESKTDFLSYYQYRKDDQGENGYDRQAHIVSVHANRRLNEHFTLSGRFASKWQSYKGIRNYDSSIQLIDGRLIWMISDRFDLDVHGGFRLTEWGRSRETLIGLGVSAWVVENLRVTVGYNFTGFKDKDLDPEGLDLQGFYWKLAFKFDEGLFSWLQ